MNTLRKVLNKLQGAPEFFFDEIPDLKSDSRYQYFSGWIFEKRGIPSLQVFGDKQLLFESRPSLIRKDITKKYSLSPNHPTGFIIPIRKELLHSSTFRELSISTSIANQSFQLWQSKIDNIEYTDISHLLNDRGYELAPLTEHREIVNKEFIEDTITEVQDIVNKSSLVFLLKSWARGGGSLSVQQHIKYLRAEGINASAILIDSFDHIPTEVKSYVKRLSHKTLNAVDFASIPIIATYWETAEILGKLKGENNCYYYVQDYEPWFYPPHSDSWERAKKTYSLGFSCIVKTEYLASVLKNEEALSSTVIPPGIDTEIFYPDIKVPNSIDFVALYRPSTPWRGAKQLVELIDRLVENNPSLNFYLFGEIIDFPPHLRSHVIFLGSLSPNEIASYYQKAKFSIDLSEWQGFGRASLEAMACGAVPILSQLTGTATYAVDGENSLVVDLENLEASAAKVIELIKNEAELAKLKEAAIATGKMFPESKASQTFYRAICN